MLNFVLSFNSQGRQKCTLHVSCFKVPMLIRNDGLTSEESKAKNRLLLSRVKTSDSKVYALNASIF